MTVTKEVTLILSRQDGMKVSLVDKTGRGVFERREHPMQAGASVWVSSV